MEKGIMLKLAKCREAFMEKNVVKSGYNQYTKSNYFTLADIVNAAEPIFYKYGLFCDYSLGVLKNAGEDVLMVCLECYDTEGEMEEPYSSSISVKLSSSSGMQNAMEIGAISTYARRYLLLMLLNIVEPDELEIKGMEEKKKEEEEKKKKERQERDRRTGILVIKRMVEEMNIDQEKLMARYQVRKWGDLDYMQVCKLKATLAKHSKEIKEGEA